MQNGEHKKINVFPFTVGARVGVALYWKRGLFRKMCL